MKKLRNLCKTIFISLLLIQATISFGQSPTYTCIAKNDTLLSPTVFQFDIYIYRTGSIDLYLNNFQLSFAIQNISSILNSGTLTGAYIAVSTELPSSYAPGGVSILPVGVGPYVRVNACPPSSNGTLVPPSGLRIGTFQITNTVAFGQSNMNMIWRFTAPATSNVKALVPPPSGTVTPILDSLVHSTNFVDPILNGPVTVFNMTGGGNYCSSTGGVAFGLDGSQAGVLYMLIKDGNPVGAYIPGTGSPISFGIQTTGTYTCSAYRKATYITGNMNGSVTATGTTVLPTISGNNSLCAGTTGVVYTTEPGMTSYNWSVPTGGVITSGGTPTDNTATVTWNTAGAQTVSVNYVNGICAASSPTVYNVTVNAVPNTPVITTSGDTLRSNISSGNQWYLNGNPIAGQTSQTLIATTTGHYWDMITNGNCSSDTSHHIYLVITDIKTDVSATNVQIFPNPNNGSFTLTFNFPGNENFDLSVFNAAGMKIFAKTNCYSNGQDKKEIDMGKVPPGIYSLVLENIFIKTVKKIIVL